jgi:hypothetical protein
MRTVDAPVWGSLLPMACDSETSLFGLEERPTEQMIRTPVKKAWPLMTPAERLAIWEEARLAWAHDATDVIADIEQGRDEADREFP